MKQNKKIKLVEIPILESTAEGKLRGGFSRIFNGGISLLGGPNDSCGNNDVCTDNKVCYDNKSSQDCVGNHGTSCSSKGSTPTSIPTSPSASPTGSSLMIGNIFSFI